MSDTTSRSTTQRVISPPLDQLERLRTPLEPGEREVLEFFDRCLPPEWEIYIQPHLNGRRPDFVLLNPQVGIGIFEVKDWSTPDRYRAKGSMSIQFLDDNEAWRPKQNPIAYVHQTKLDVLELYCRRLTVRFAEDKDAMAAVSAGVIMTRMTTSQAMGFLSPSREHLSKQYGRYLTISGMDALAKGDLAAIFPEATRDRSYIMKPEMAADLRDWLVEPDMSKTQRVPLRIELSTRQRHEVESDTARAQRRFKGPAGSGKSLMLAARAARQAALGRNVLVVTYNITLWHYLRDLAVRSPVEKKDFKDRITWVNFHRLCRELCEDAGLYEKYKELWHGTDEDQVRDAVIDSELPDLAEQAVELLGEYCRRYDSILIDEGQDYLADWINLVRKLLAPDGEMWLVADATQDLYGRMKGAGFRGDWNRLEGSYRCPQNLVRLLRDYASDLLKGADVLGPDDPQGTLFGDARLRWIQTQSKTLLDVANHQLFRFPGVEQSKNVAWADIVMLAPTNDLGIPLVEALRAKNVKVTSTLSNNSRASRLMKNAFWMGTPDVKATTIHSFKGWEGRAVFVVIEKAETQDDRKAVYVALSRLKHSPDDSYLTVICAEPSLEAWGRKWPTFELVESSDPKEAEA